ncbi:MAG: hypothetical protein ABIO85_06875 [Sphingomicrobium sp.]
MRIALLWLPLVVAGCSAGTPSGAPGLAPGTFAGAGKDRLCIAGEGAGLRAGLIVYGADGAANCSLAGKLTHGGTGWTLTPHGEGACAVSLIIAGDRVAVTQVPAACAYYCGPRASLAGKSFTGSATASAAVDLAGDRLCG